jgi:hypothetical protein
MCTVPPPTQLAVHAVFVRLYAVGTLTHQVRLIPGQRHEKIAPAVQDLVVDKILLLVMRPLL